MIFFGQGPTLEASSWGRIHIGEGFIFGYEATFEEDFLGQGPHYRLYPGV